MSKRLTEQEKNVLYDLAQGLVNSEIAQSLHISVHTVKAHLEAIYEKLSVKNRVQAVIKSILLGLIDLNTLI